MVNVFWKAILEPASNCLSPHGRILLGWVYLFAFRLMFMGDRAEDWVDIPFADYVQDNMRSN